MFNMVEIGNNLLELRKKCDFTQVEVADKLIDYCLKNNIKREYVLTNGIYFSSAESR